MESVEQLLNIDPADVQKMTTKELRAAVQTLSSAANKRLSRLEQSEIDVSSPALHAVYESGRSRFSTRGKNLNQLRNEFKDVKNFLTSKTSTIKGVKGWKSKIEKKAGGEFTPAEFSEFGVLFGKLRVAVGRDAIQRAGSEQVIRWLRREMADKRNQNDEDVIYSVIARMNGMYEEYEEQRAAEWGELDDFYDIDEAEEDELPFD